MTLFENYSLTGLNTLGFEVVAERFARPETLEQLVELLALADVNGWPVLVLGGGSNLILSAWVPGLVIQLANSGVKPVRQQGNQVTIEVAAAESWHGLVESTLQQGWFGLENMALIPGTVGAAPIQNIGAYGVELKDSFVSLTAWDREQRQLVTIEADQCDFGYRYSRFKGRDAGRFVIWSVRFLLNTVAHLQLEYGGLATYLAGQGITSPVPQQVFTAVCDIRNSKLPDPVQVGNVGSFFENPIISQAQYDELRGRFPSLVAFPDAPGLIKLAAGWLIDQAGWKGHRQGAVGVYDKQALVLVNHGDGDREQLLALARQIQASVSARFGVELQIEPRRYPL